MAKKGSVEKGPMTSEEVKKHFENPRYNTITVGHPRIKVALGDPRRKISIFLSKILSKKPGLLSDKTRHNAHKMLVEDLIEDNKKVLDRIKSQVIFLHDFYKPDYILLTESSAVPVGYVIKEAWKTAYPNEKLPKFLRVVPFGLREDRKEVNRSFFEKRVKDKNAKILVYDEEKDTGSSISAVLNALKEEGYKNILGNFDRCGMEKMLDKTYLESGKYKKLSDKQKKEVDKLYKTIHDFISTPLHCGGITTKSSRGSRPNRGGYYGRKYASEMKKSGVYTTNHGLTADGFRMGI